MRGLLVLTCLAACGRVAFEPLGAASTSEDAAVDARPDAAPPLACDMVGLGCTDGGFMVCGSACFAYCNDQGVTQAAASDRCTAWSGGLASIASPAEQTCVDGLGTNDAWIGLVQATGAAQVSVGWSWSDGTVAPITGWMTGEPQDEDDIENGTEQCAIQSGLGWIDVDCTEAKPFICKRPAP